MYIRGAHVPTRPMSAASLQGDPIDLGHGAQVQVLDHHVLLQQEIATLARIAGSDDFGEVTMMVSRGPSN